MSPKLMLVPSPIHFRFLVLAGLVVAALLEVVDVSIVNVALPQMAGNLGATADQIAWVATGYTLANAVVLPMTAWLSQTLGRKRYLLLSIAVFTLGSLLCGLSRSLGEIVLWRIGQGMAGAALISTAQATVVEIFPVSQQGLVQSVFGFSVLLAPAVAPWLGGWITDNYSWPWVFFINLPIGLAALALVGLFLHDPPEHSGAVKPGQTDVGPADWLGIGLLMTGLGALQYVLEEGQRQDWFGSVLLVRLLLLSVVSLIGLVFWELSPRNCHPVVDLRVYKERSLAAGVPLNFATGFGLYGLAFVLPQFLQNVLSLTPTASGAALVPEGLATLAAVVLCGTLLDKKIDPRLLIAAGLAVGAWGLWDLTHLSTQSGLENTLPGVLLEGAGVGFLIIPISVAAFGNLKGAQIGQGAAQLGLGRQLGGSFGIAILQTTVARAADSHRAALVAHLYAGSWLVSDRLAETASALTAHGMSAASAPLAALGLLEQTLRQQALALGYLDAFRLLCFAYTAALPLVLLLKRPDSAAKPALGH